MVDEGVERRAQELREVAAKLRLLAQQTRSSDARRQLTDLADRFDQMATEMDPPGSAPGAEV